jgi:FSR family fosmidomycin resistance protein-like MFS transporter
MISKALILLVAGHFVTDINTGALPAFLPFIKDSLGLSYTVTASIILVFNVTSSVIQPVFGYLSDRWSIRWLLPVGPFLASLGLGLLGLSPSYSWILLFASLSGLGQAGYHPEGFKTINLLSGKRKATVISIFHFGGNLGFGVGPLLATFFFVHLGLKGSLFFIVPGILITAVFLTFPEWKVPTDLPGRRASSGKIRNSSRQSRVPMVLLLLTVILRSATRLGLMTFVPFYFINTLNRDPMTVGQYLSTFLLAGTAGVLAGGPLGDRFGYKKMVLLTLGLSSVFLYLFYVTEGTLSLILFTVAGLILISSNSVTMAMGQSFMPRNLGMASGLILGLAMGVGGIAVTLLGWVADHWGVPFALQITFVLPVLAFLTCWPLPYPPPREEILYPEPSKSLAGN